MNNRQRLNSALCCKPRVEFEAKFGRPMRRTLGFRDNFFLMS